jgi:linoleoyl-CoA desaturase
MQARNSAAHLGDQHSPPSFSYEELKQKVQGYLAESGISPLGRWPMIGKGVLILGIWIAAYASILAWGPRSVPAALSAALLLVACTVAVELAIMHDASHRSVSPRAKVNKILGLTLTLAGGSSILWYQQHVISHHGQTNVPGKDPDIETGGLFRFRDGEPWKPWHRWQHLYALPLYSMVAFRWIWSDDLRKTLRNTFGLKGKQFGFLVAELILSRVSHVLIFLVLPILAFGSVAHALIFYVAHWLVFGATIAVIFQLAHVSNVQVFPEKERAPKEDWALHQLATTANFAVRNRLLTWYIGGLNHQIEHHIFQRISSLHHPKIQPIVKQYCLERNAPYFEYASFGSAVRAHFAHLKRLARPPVAA